MSSKIPVRPFRPLPPLVRMERISDDLRKIQTTGPNTDNSWVVDSPTNRSVALLVTNASGMSNDATMATTPNDDSNDLWNPLMMMIDDDCVHGDDCMGDRYYSNSPNPVSTTAANQTKRVSLDASDACMMDVDDNRDQQQHRPALPPAIIASNDEHEFEFMEGLEHDPLLTLSVTCGGDIIGTSACRISDGIAVPESVPHRLPSLRHLLSRHDYDIDGDVDNDPWTEAATETVFQLTSKATAGVDSDHNDLMIFEIDQSFLKGTTTVGTESTVSSCSSVSPDFLSVFNGDNSNLASYNPASTVVPTFFTSNQFQERCQLLSESMRVSQLSRQCLSLQENVKLRANLAKVLKDIERSTAKVQRHCLSQQMQQSTPLASTTSATVAETDNATCNKDRDVQIPSTSIVENETHQDLLVVECGEKNSTSLSVSDAKVEAVTTTAITPIDESLLTTTAAINSINCDQNVPTIE